MVKYGHCSLLDSLLGARMFHCSDYIISRAHKISHTENILRDISLSDDYHCQELGLTVIVFSGATFGLWIHLIFSLYRLTSLMHNWSLPCVH